jgi:hypothetical protein
MTATVHSNGGTGSLPPTGTVSFWDGAVGTGRLLGTATLNSNGTATFINRNRGLGTHSINVSYASNSANFASSSTATAATLVVKQATTTTTVALSTSSATVGQAVVATATVKSNGGSGSLPPSGTVTFWDGSVGTGTLLGTLTLDATGVAKLTMSHLASGKHVINAHYVGNVDFALSNTLVGAVVTVS